MFNVQNKIIFMLKTGIILLEYRKKKKCWMKWNAPKSKWWLEYNILNRNFVHENDFYANLQRKVWPFVLYFQLDKSLLFFRSKVYEVINRINDRNVIANRKKIQIYLNSFIYTCMTKTNHQHYSHTFHRPYTTPITRTN